MGEAQIGKKDEVEGGNEGRDNKNSKEFEGQ